MDSTFNWTLTIIGGVIVGFIILYIEYNYFQKKKAQQDPAPQIDAAPKSPTSLPRPSNKSNSDLSWPDAINRAVDSFSKLHPNKTVIVNYVSAERSDWAFIGVTVVSNARNERFNITLNKKGEILSMKSA